MTFKRVKLRELLRREKTLLKQLDNATEWTPRADEATWLSCREKSNGN